MVVRRDEPPARGVVGDGMAAATPPRMYLTSSLTSTTSSTAYTAVSTTREVRSSPAETPGETAAAVNIGDRRDIAVVVDSIGAMDTFRQLMPAMQHNSHLVSAGFLGTTGMVDIQELRPLEMTLHSPSGWSQERMDGTLEGIREGWLQTTPLITHILPASQGAEAPPARAWCSRTWVFGTR